MSVADALRAGLESGSFGALGECYADDAVLDLNVRGGRERIDGPAAIVGRLEQLFPGPGRLVQWTATLHEAGAAVWLERVSETDGAVLDDLIQTDAPINHGNSGGECSSPFPGR